MGHRCSECRKSFTPARSARKTQQVCGVCFRDLKQLLGFADSSARKRQAVERMAPFVGYTYTLLILWFADGIWRTPVAQPPIRPWYTHRKHASFADVLRAAQRTLASVDVLDPARDISNLHQLAKELRNTGPENQKWAA